jgi:ABC-type antimicrobial peptide transport system permease subunit
MRQNILIFAGILGFIFGIVFLLQGLGVIRYPADSFMIDNHVWVLRGGIIAALSAILVAGVRLVPSKRDKRVDGE